MPDIRGKYLGCGIHVDFTGDEDGMKEAKEKLPSESLGKFRWCGNVLTVYDEEIWTLLRLPPIEESTVRTSLPRTPVLSSHISSDAYVVSSVHKRRLIDRIKQILCSLMEVEEWDMTNEYLSLLNAIIENGFDTNACRFTDDVELRFTNNRNKRYLQLKQKLIERLVEEQIQYKLEENLGQNSRCPTFDVFYLYA